MREKGVMRLWKSSLGQYPIQVELSIQYICFLSCQLDIIIALLKKYFSKIWWKKHKWNVPVNFYKRLDVYKKVEEEKNCGKKEWISSGLMGQIAKGQMFKNPLWFSCALWFDVDWIWLWVELNMVQFAHNCSIYSQTHSTEPFLLPFSFLFISFVPKLKPISSPTIVDH